MFQSNIKHVFRFDFLTIASLLIFFACPLRAFLPTSFIVEGFSLVLLFYYDVSLKKNRFSISFKKSTVVLALVLSVLFCLGLVTDYDDFCFKENYRFFVQFVFLAIFVNRQFNYERALQIAFWLCVFHIPFTIYEVVYINLISPSDFTGVFLTGPAMSLYDEDSQYLIPSWDLGFPMLRPFGLMLQPQKSGFVFVFGMLTKYLLDIKQKKEINSYWYYLFLLATIATAGKTSIIVAFLFLVTIKFNLYPRTDLSSKQIVWCIIIGLICLLYFAVHTLAIDTGGRTQATGDIVNDLACIFNYPIGKAILGYGIPSVQSLKAHGFIVESYLARVVLQLGYLPFLIISIWAVKLYKANRWKVNYMMLLLVFGLMGHYCILNTPFFQFLLCVVVCYYKQNKI